MPFHDLYSPLATLAVFAATYWSPPLRRRRQIKHAVNRRLYGSEPVKDRNGKPIAPGTDSLFAQLDTMQDTVNNAALLNGQGERLVADMAWLRKNLSAHIKDTDAHK